MNEVQWDWPDTKATVSGGKVDIVKKMFLARESMNVDNFVKFYTDDTLYQFSNFPIVYGPGGIRKSMGASTKRRDASAHRTRFLGHRSSMLGGLIALVPIITCTLSASKKKIDIR